MENGIETVAAAKDIWIHNIDPFLIHISGNVGVRWYGLAYVTGFVCAYLFMRWFSKHKLSPLTEEQVSDFITYLILGVLLGGRFGYVLFYSPELLTDFRSSFPFWGALAVWEGGMASHGGFMGVLIACLIFAKRHKLPFLHLGDLTISGASIGIFFGRIANFINGELMGKVCSSTYQFAVKFPQDIFRWIGYEPDKLHKLDKVAAAAGVTASDWKIWMNNIPAHRRRLYDFAELVVQKTQEGNQEVIAALQPVLEPRHPSQIYAALSEGLIPFLVLALFWYKKRKAGLICSIYYIIYSIGRVVNENFRLPDAHIADLSQQPLGISRGQFLSLFLFMIGVATMIWAARRKSELYGGWGTIGKSDK